MACPYLAGAKDANHEAYAAELKEFLDKGELEPDRGDLADESIKWREGRPDYTKANVAFLKGRSMKHQAGSLELLVENLVKEWEMEASHKMDLAQWKTVEQSEYCVSANGGRVLPGAEAFEMGNYNWLMEACPAHLYDSKAHTFESSHKLITGAFSEGFPWELLRVFSGPPKVAIEWRHWGKVTGPYKGLQGNGEEIEMRGFGVITVNDKLKVCKIEIYYKPDEFLQALEAARIPAPDLDAKA